MLGDWVTACPPGEFEPQAAIVLGFNQLLPFYPQVMLDVVATLIERIPLVGVVDSEEQRRHVVTTISDWGLPAHLLNFVFMPVHGMWVRDYGPVFVRQSGGGVTVLDAQYPLADRPNDDRAPSALASLLRLPAVQVPLALEGGNLLSNGQGLCITTTALTAWNQNRGYNDSRILDILDEYYGFQVRCSLGALPGEPTGHVDLFVTLAAPDLAVVGSYDPKAEPEAARILDRDAEFLASAQTRSGRMRVVRIPMPPRSDGKLRTYTNVIYANGTVLVPLYPDVAPELDKKALGLYAELLPGWEIIGIDISAMIHLRGALRCMSVNIPWLTDRFVPPPRPATSAHQLRPLARMCYRADSAYAYR